MLHLPGLNTFGNGVKGVFVLLVPLAPKLEEPHAKLRLTTKAGTLEIMDADRSVLDQVLQAMLHAE